VIISPRLAATSWTFIIMIDMGGCKNHADSIISQLSINYNRLKRLFKGMDSDDVNFSFKLYEIHFTQWVNGAARIHQGWNLVIDAGLFA
jgi:hypothetical protein